MNLRLLKHYEKQKGIWLDELFPSRVNKAYRDVQYADMPVSLSESSNARFNKKGKISILRLTGLFSFLLAQYHYSHGLITTCIDPQHNPTPQSF